MNDDERIHTTMLRLPSGEKRTLRITAAEIDKPMNTIIRACLVECLKDGPEYIADLIKSHEMTECKATKGAK